MATQQMVVLCALLTIVVHSTLACFVTNCPPGGKRSALSYGTPARRQCTTCGSDNKGRCFSSNICCGEFGCVLSSAETLGCRKENFVRTPCHNEGPACGFNGKGVCAADGFCCDESGCQSDAKCNLSSMLSLPSFS